ncbi:MAG: 5-formyltetrahydrofolate cyclo-ligase [Rhodocyclaceae bacterium]|nr:5-formyltetrahydrofolate cyclo-ligase [Rhodocyclaceae bacterium]
MPEQSTQSPANSEDLRSRLRAEKIAARLSLPEAARQAASERILAELDALLATFPPATIGFCWPIRAEVDCRPLITSLLARGWQAVMPTVIAPAAPMEFRPWSSDAPMTLDPFGIPVPATPPAAPPEVLLVPLVAFDAAGFRLGYGGGFFDRTLAACTPRPFSIGVGFELARVATIAPGPHDVPLDAIVTERGLMRFKDG